MFNNNLDELYFSQMALSVYQNCPLRFRRRYLDGLFWPRDWAGDREQKELLERGKLFHRLACRYYSRGEVLTEGILAGELRKWFEDLRKFLPFNEEDDFYPEYELRINFNGIKLLAKFDLLYLRQSDNKLLIYDWKTNKKPFSKKVNYETLLQSRVYLYVLSEALQEYPSGESLSPEELGLVYWNPRFPGDMEMVKYSQRKFERDKNFLRALIQEIKTLSYEKFEGIDKDEVCRYCEYRPICSGKKPELIEMEEEDADFELDWETIDEIEF